MTVLESEMKIVEKKAKKYKKFLEKMEVNRNPVNINGKHYYEVIYTNRKGEVTATAILSPDQEVESEARKAHPLLAMYNGLVINITETASERAKASEVFYKEPLKLMRKYDLPQLEAGKERIERLDVLLEKHKAYFHETIETFKLATVISQIDIDYALKMAASMEIIHVEILEIFTEDLPVIDEWVTEMKVAGLWEKLGQNVQDFYTEILKGKESSLETLDLKRRPVSDKWEDQIEEVLEMSERDLEQKVNHFKKDLRYPEPW